MPWQFDPNTGTLKLVTPNQYGASPPATATPMPGLSSVGTPQTMTPSGGVTTLTGNVSGVKPGTSTALTVGTPGGPTVPTPSTPITSPKSQVLATSGGGTTTKTGGTTAATGVGAGAGTGGLQTQSSASPFTFYNMVTQMQNQVNTNNALLQQRQLILKQLYDSPLTADERAKLDPQFLKAIDSGDRNTIDMNLRLISDQISGRTNTIDQSVQYLTSAYQNSISQAETYKQNAIDTVLNYAKANGQRPSTIMQALYPDVAASIGPQLDALASPFLTTSQVGAGGGAAGAGIAAGVTGSPAIDTSIPGYYTEIVSGTGGQTQAQIDAAAMYSINNGGAMMPGIGLSSTGAGLLKKNSIMARYAEMLQGQNPALAKANIASLSGALKTQQNLLSANETALNTLDKQLGLLESYSDKVDRTGSPILNKYALYLKGQVQGDADTQALQNIVLTASTEFAKILSGSAASVSGVTISSADDAKNLLNANMTAAQIKQITSVMKQEGQFRLQSQQDTVDKLLKSISTVGTGQTGATETGNLEQDVDSDIKSLGKQYPNREQLILALVSAYPEKTQDEIAAIVYQDKYKPYVN